jgi:hypothetical protein
MPQCLQKDDVPFVDLVKKVVFYFRNCIYCGTPLEGRQREYCSRSHLRLFVQRLDRGCDVFTAVAKRPRKKNNQLWSYWTGLLQEEATTNTSRGREWDITSENFKKYLETDLLEEENSIDFTPSNVYRAFIGWMDKEKIICKNTEVFYEMIGMIQSLKLQTDTLYKEDSVNVSTVKVTPTFKKPKAQKLNPSKVDFALRSRWPQEPL